MKPNQSKLWQIFKLLLLIIFQWLWLLALVFTLVLILVSLAYTAYYFYEFGRLYNGYFFVTKQLLAGSFGSLIIPKRYLLEFIFGWLVAFAATILAFLEFLRRDGR